MRRMQSILSVVLLLGGAVLLRADDAEAGAKVESALELCRSRDYKAAAEQFEAAELLADDPELKQKALRSTVTAYREAGLPQREFNAIEKLLERYPSQPDFVQLTARQYELADACYGGAREPAFWSLRWIPWLTRPDETVQMYETALKRAPFAERGAAARLRLAFRLEEDGKIDAAMEQLRTILKDYPQAKERKFTYLALGELLYERSRRGDGDGRFGREALAVFQEFKEHYPDAPENDFVDKCLLKLHDSQAAHLLNIAKFYEKNGRRDAAERYLHAVLQEYPDSKSAAASEELLIRSNPTYTPDGYLPAPVPREQSYSRHRIPEESMPLLIAPGNSDGKYLLPIYDIRNRQAAEAGQEANHEK